MTSEYDRQGKKLETYTEISTTLAKVSNSAAAAVAPNLAEILLDHAHTKNRLDQGLNAVGQVWQEIFLAVTKEVGKVIDSSLQQALVALRTEAVTAVNAAITQAPELPTKFPRGAGSLSDLSTKRQREDDEDRPSDKRFKIDEYGSLRRTSTDERLQEMQLKLEQQLTSINILTKENDEVCLIARKDTKGLTTF